MQAGREKRPEVCANSYSSWFPEICLTRPSEQSCPWWGWCCRRGLTLKGSCHTFGPYVWHVLPLKMRSCRCLVSHSWTSKRSLWSTIKTKPAVGANITHTFESLNACQHLPLSGDEMQQSDIIMRTLVSQMRYAPSSVCFVDWCSGISTQLRFQTERSVGQLLSDCLSAHNHSAWVTHCE